MVRKLKIAALLLVLQAAFYLGTFFLVIWLRSDCTVANDFYCSGTSSSNVYLPIIAFLALPPIATKLLLDRFKRKVVWRKLLITHAGVALLATVTAFIISSLTSGCGCGGA